MKQTLIWFNLQRDGTGNGLPNIKDTFVDITSDYGFLLRLVSTFTIDTDEYYPMCYKVNGCQDL